jgi:hypothetical protein
MKKSKTFLLRDREALQARFAMRVVGRLSESAEHMPHHIDERLRVAREQALERARQARRSAAAETATAVVTSGPSVASLSPRHVSPWWVKLAALFPLIMLIAGLTVIEELHYRNQISAAAEIDAALLADSVPPDAYRDPGFVEFLKTAQ